MCQSRCGKLCSECENREECACEGCLSLVEGDWAGNCEIKKCCEDKYLEHCGLCTEFPCPLLRNTAFDPDEGDDGERLVTLKHWSENKLYRNNDSKNRIIAGIAVGFTIGAILGAISDSFAAFTFACTLVGAAVSVMIDITKKK